MTDELKHFSVYFNRDLVTHGLIQELKNDRSMRESLAANEEALLRGYPGLTEQEIQMISARDFRGLYLLGVHPYLLGQFARLLYGTVEGTGTSMAASALVASLNQRSF